MSPIVTAALISLSGAILSVLISYLAGRWQVKAASARLLVETRNAFGSRVYERRLELYPEYYAYVSDFIKTINFGEVTKQGLLTLLGQMQTWDSRNGILLGASTHKVCSYVRHHLFRLTQESDEAILTQFSDQQKRAALKKDLQSVELALKDELGVFMFRSPTEFIPISRFATYDDAHKERFPPRVE